MLPPSLGQLDLGADVTELCIPLAQRQLGIPGIEFDEHIAPADARDRPDAPALVFGG